MISFIRTLNKKGPITDPWGTPDVMCCNNNVVCLDCTLLAFQRVTRIPSVDKSYQRYALNTI